MTKVVAEEAKKKAAQKVIKQSVRQEGTQRRKNMKTRDAVYNQMKRTNDFSVYEETISKGIQETMRRKLVFSDI